MSATLEKAVSLGCGCLCDDVRLSFEGEKIVRAENVCPAGEAWFLASRPGTAAATISGEAATANDALERAARLLKEAKAPLVFGLSHALVHTQQAAVRLADRIAATIDVSPSANIAPLLALQQVGASTATWGEIRHRADLLVFWGADPAKDGEKHLERLGLRAGGAWTETDHGPRTVIVLDSQPIAVRHLADMFLPIDTGRDYELVSLLRCALAGRAISSGTAGISAEEIADLAARLKGCRTGAIFYGAGLLAGAHAHQTLEALHRLIQELHQHARFYAAGWPSGGNRTGAENVLAWQTGYPLAVNLARGYPRYSPGEYSVGAILERHEADLCLIVGRDELARLSPRAAEHLAKIPTIALEAAHAVGEPAGFRPTVELSTAVDGIHVAGTAYRSDGVALPVPAVLPAQLPSKAHLLDALGKLLG